MDNNKLKMLSKKTVAIKNVSRTPLWYTKQTGKFDSKKPQAAVEEHIKKLFCNYLAAAKKLTVYFSAELAEAYSIVNRGRQAADYDNSCLPKANCTTEAEKRSYEKMRISYMSAVRANEDMKGAAADARAFIDAANEILVSRMDAMRKNTFAHVHAYLSGVCSKNSEMNIDLAQCFQDCMTTVKEDDFHAEKAE